MGRVRVTELEVMPDGMTDDECAEWDMNAFTVRVEWRGPRNVKGSAGGWAVKHFGSELTRRGNWIWLPRPFQRHIVRFATMDEAIRAAQAVVNDITVNGRTFADVKRQKEERDART